MAKEATQEQVMEAARALGKDEFTREDVAKQLGLEIAEMRPGWKAAKEAGQVEKVQTSGDDRVFKLSS